MGFKIQSLFFQISLSLILFFLLISSSSAKLLPYRSDVQLRRHRTTLHGGAPTTPFLLNPQRAVDQYKGNKLQMAIKKKSKKKKKTTTARFESNGNNNNKGRAFSVMLPKGFVPPSGSSPCHNQSPQSSSPAFYCHLSAATNRP